MKFAIQTEGQTASSTQNFILRTPASACRLRDMKRRQTDKQYALTQEQPKMKERTRRTFDRSTASADNEQLIPVWPTGQRNKPPHQAYVRKILSRVIATSHIHRSENLTNLPVFMT